MFVQLGNNRVNINNISAYMPDSDKSNVIKIEYHKSVGNLKWDLIWFNTKKERKLTLEALDKLFDVKIISIENLITRKTIKLE